MDASGVTKVLTPKELRTVEFSIDKVCTLFFHDGKVLRGVHEDYIDQVKEMFSSGLIEELCSKELFVKTWISDVQIEGFELVVEHERIDPWNYPYEWSFHMLRDAAQTILETNEIANQYGFELFDVHAYNVVFDMCRPKYIDFGSFFRIDPRNGKCWSGYINFYNSLYIPLYLYNKGYSDMPNSIFLYNGFFNEKDIFLLRHRYATFFGNWIGDLFFKLHHNSRRLAVARYTRVMEKFGHHKHIKKILRLKKFWQNRFTVKKARRLLSNVSKSNIDSYWKDYHTHINPDENSRFLRLAEIIRTELKDAKTLIELASNQGKFANFLLESTQINTIVASDYDKNAVDTIYLGNRGNGNLLPLLYDFVRPNQRNNTTPIHTRVKGDIIMALAVTHHLLLSQDVSIDHIFKVLAGHTEKYVIVEFMPLGLYYGDLETIPDIPDYYTLDWFKKHFSEHFEPLLDEKIEINRHVFVGKLKSE